MQKVLQEQERLEIKEAMVEKLLVENKKIKVYKELKNIISKEKYNIIQWNYIPLYQKNATSYYKIIKVYIFIFIKRHVI